MDTTILLSSIREQLELDRDSGGALIMKQFLRDLETYPMDVDSTEATHMHPDRFAARIIASYETLRHASTGEAQSDFKRLFSIINHKESFPFGDPRYINSFQIHSPSSLVIEHMKQLQDICIRNSQDADGRWLRECTPVDLELFFERLRILLNIQTYSIFMAFMTFVGAVWRDGFYDYVVNRLQTATRVDVPLGKTIVTVDNDLSCYVTFSPNKTMDTKTPRQWIGVTFSKGILEDKGGCRGSLYTCCVDQRTALSLINETVEAWQKAKKKLLR
ncbi:MAG: hypothetical protein HGA38_04020 [Candidatus Moranbacteria bacterium]|nr:hypothetical protein [Candidatus Moranbacteria bacterium]